MAAENNCEEYLVPFLFHGAEINIKDKVSKNETRVSVGYMKLTTFVINIYYYLLALLLFIIIIIFC